MITTQSAMLTAQSAQIAQLIALVMQRLPPPEHQQGQQPPPAQQQQPPPLAEERRQPTQQEQPVGPPLAAAAAAVVPRLQLLPAAVQLRRAALQDDAVGALRNSNMPRIPAIGGGIPTSWDAAEQEWRLLDLGNFLNADHKRWPDGPICSCFNKW